MKYYTAHYGSWKDGGSVNRLEPSASKKEMIARAQKVANKTGLPVTVMSKAGGWRGLYIETIAVVEPQKTKK